MLTLSNIPAGLYLLSQ